MRHLQITATIYVQFLADCLGAGQAAKFSWQSAGSCLRQVYRSHEHPYPHKYSPWCTTASFRGLTSSFWGRLQKPAPASEHAGLGTSYSIRSAAGLRLGPDLANRTRSRPQLEVAADDAAVWKQEGAMKTTCTRCRR